MAKRQITLPGKRKNPRIPPEEVVKIDLDDQLADGGTPIDQGMYEYLVNEFIQQGAVLRDKECQFYSINNQLLQILLSSQGCTGLLLSKCKQQDGTESIAFIAIQEDGTPKHWLRAGDVAEPNTSDVSSGEWIHGYTIAEIRAKFLANKIAGQETINFEALFEDVGEKKRKQKQQ